MDRIAAARIVGANWRLRRRLPRVTALAHSLGFNIIVYDASEIGLLVGVFPAVLRLYGTRVERIAYHKDTDGDVTYVAYRDESGALYHIYND
jgi:hypothetical protein